MLFIKSKQVLQDKEKYVQRLQKSFGLIFSHSTDFGNTCFRYKERE